MKKWFAFLLILALTLTSALALAEQTTITMSTWLATEDGTKAVYQEMLDDFMAANPDIKVEVIALPFNQNKDQVLLAGTNGDAADVIMGNSQMMGAFNAAGLCAELDGLIDPEITKDIYPGYLSGTTYDGKLKAVSWAPHPLVLYYNVELFAAAGLDPATPPATWDDMLDAARKIAALGRDGDGNQLYGLGIPTAKVTYSGAALNGILYAYGGRFVDENGNVDIVSDANIAVFQMLKELTDEMVIPSALEIKDLRGMFASGTLGMIVDSDAALATFRSASGQGKAFDEKISVCTIPIGATGRSETVYTEHQLTVYAKSEKKEAAIKLVEFLISRDAMVKYHAACAILSPRASIATLPEMNEDAFTETFNRQSLTASPLPASNPMFDNAMNEMTKAMERIIIGGEDIKSVLEETQQTIAELYDRY